MAKITPEQSAKDAADFAAAFNESIPVKHEPTEDEAFGLAEEKKGPDSSAAAESSSDSGTTDAGTGGDAPAVAIVLTPEDPAAGGDVPTDDMPKDPKDLQRMKSWEGRLRAREEELARREAELKGKNPEAKDPNESSEPAAEEKTETPAQEAAEVKSEAGESPTEEAGESAVTEALEQAAENVDSGKMSAEDALKTLANDFGEDFTKMLGILIDARASEIAGKAADEKVAGVSKNLDSVVEELVNDRQRAHFEKISTAHPDYLEIAQSPEFKEYVDKLPASEKEAALNTIGSGTAKQINDLLTAYKESTKPQTDDTAIDAAEGVRNGSSLKLPEKPGQSQDYENAWNEF